MSNMTKRQKEMVLVVLAVVVLLGSAAFSYFSLYAPAKEARLQSEQLLSSEKEVLMSLQAQQKSAPPTEKISTSELQQKVSVEPLTDLILLQVEQAELLSDILVTSVNFAEAPVMLAQPVEGLENVQEVLTTIEFDAADYKNITTFIKEIETMERIMIVDSIDFASNPEVTKEDQEGEPLTVTVSFSAFYRPDLIKLEDTLPKVDSPAPAKKSNPLPKNDGTDLIETDSASSGASEESAESASPVSEADSQKTEEISIVEPAEDAKVAGVQSDEVHQVEAGDTLSGISLEYFGDANQVAELQEANGLDSTLIFTGATLIIPQLA